MPFDVRGYEPHTLADHLEMVGITPVPMAILGAHKAEQVRQHPGSMLNKPLPYLIFSGLVVCTFATASMILWPCGSISDLLARLFVTCVLIIVGTGLSVVATMLFCDLFDVRVLDKAVWLERVWCYQDIPPPIEDIIARIGDVRWSAGVTIWYGELIQNEVMLDPYIVVRTATEEVCLGIWDDDRIIAIADLH